MMLKSYGSIIHTNMSPEQQRVALAFLDEWRILRSLAKHTWILEHRGITKEIFLWGRGEGDPTLLNRINDLPDYLNDLNAIREVEAATFSLNETDATVLPYQWKNKCDRYVNELSVIVHGLSAATAFPIIVASAEQRAEAILRTMDLWRENAEA
jgi:hypothetical protein